VQKSLRRLPAGDQQRITAALKEIGNDPYSGDVARLKNHRFGWRRRVGNYRILFNVDPAACVIQVKVITRRTKTTYD